MNAWTQRKLRGDDAAGGAAFCAAPRARFRSSVQRNRGVSDPGSGARDRPAPCSGVAHATAVRCPRIVRADSARLADIGTRATCGRSEMWRFCPRGTRWSSRVTSPTTRRSTSRHPARDHRAVLAAVQCAPLRVARAGGAASALTAAARGSKRGSHGMAAPLHGNCRATIDEDVRRRYSADVWHGVRRHPSASSCRRTALRSPLQSAIRRPPRNITSSSVNTAATVITAVRGDRLSRAMPAHDPHPHC